LEFLSKVPTVWDQTEPMLCSVGEYVVVARRKADVWFFGAMTGWNERQVELALDFLDEGNSYRAEIFCDGTNANRIGNDYKMVTQVVKKGDKLAVKMAKGGGMAARIVENSEAE
jgi:alpha-glucosidase